MMKRMISLKGTGNTLARAGRHLILSVGVLMTFTLVLTVLYASMA